MALTETKVQCTKCLSYKQSDEMSITRAGHMRSTCITCFKAYKNASRAASRERDRADRRAPNKSKALNFNVKVDTIALSGEARLMAAKQILAKYGNEYESLVKKIYNGMEYEAKMKILDR